MTRIWKNLAAAGVVAFGLVAWGCEQTTEPPAQAETMQAEGPAELLGTLEETVTALEDVAGLASVRRSVGDAVSQTVAVVIGLEGGQLALGGHVLTVPTGAVLAPTQFIMTVIPNGGVEVNLHAIQPGVGNIGSKGFERPVQLALSYADADVDDPEDLVIVRLGTEERLETEVDRANSRVWADLDHFSRYRLCSN